jgi:hypothetical protein
MHRNGSDETKDLLLVAGGLALLAAGVGLILSHPDVRRYVKEGLSAFLPDLQEKAAGDVKAVVPSVEKYMGLGLAAVLPDIERYVKLRSM